MSIEGWTAVADGEEAAIYGYGVLTAQLSSGNRQAGLDGIDAHRAGRDAARAILAAQDESPASPVVFDLPFQVKDNGSAEKLARTIELRLAEVYLNLVSLTSGAERQNAAEGAQACTARATTWGWTPTAFVTESAPPGTPGGPSTPGTAQVPSGSAEPPISDPSSTSGDGASLE